MSPTEQQERFERWVRDHAALLHHVVNGFAEGADRNDLMQELLLALWKAIPAFRGEAQPATFIYRVTHNTALTWKRTQANYRHKVEQYESLVAPNPPETSVEPSAALLEKVYAEIRQLPPLDRSLMLLSLDGLSYREMAMIHGLSESNVGVRLNRAREKLTLNLKIVAHELR